MRVLTFAPKAFRAAREAAGLSQSDLAGQLGVTRSLIAHWEGGRRAPSWEELEQLAGLFGVPVESRIRPTRDRRSGRPGRGWCRTRHQ